MDSTYNTVFSKAILTSVFAGIITTVLCLFFDMFFRESTHFPLSAIINVSSLIFFTNIVFLIIGFIYYGFIKSMKQGNLLFMVLFGALTLVLIWKASGMHRSDDPVLNIEFHHLFKGMMIIMGVAASLGIPFLFHSKKFEEHVI